MVWDGDCDFCKKFAERFQEISKNTVEFISNQELHKKYPGAPKYDYQSSVYFLTKENSTKGAEAVFNFYYSIEKNGLRDFMISLVSWQIYQNFFIAP